MRQINKKICNLKCTVSEPNILNKENLYLVVFCHGYGAPGNDLVSVGEYLCQNDSSISENICFIFPEGPLSLDNVGLLGARAWWEIELPSLTRPIDGIDPRDLSKDIPKGMTLASNMLMDLVNQTLSIREKKAQAETNAKSVAARFTEQYGDKAESTYNSIAKELNVTVTQLNELAASAPSIVLKAAGLSAATAPVGNTTGSVNTEALNNTPKPDVTSAKVEGGSTKDLLKAWGKAGEKVKQQS